MEEWFFQEGLHEFLELFKQEKFTDLETVADITNGDLQEMSIPLGQRKKLMKKIEELKIILKKRKAVHDINPAAKKALVQTSMYHIPGS